ncbi:MAG: hypothetical protein U1C33_04405 [Candidatus Cloacimonadaceae bacterium]|nr:hypothetical protein [Candidatus Cloacimonadaceae bacterium]
MIKAVIEIGSNSLKALLFTTEGGFPQPLAGRVEISRLAEGLAKTGYISPLAFQRNLAAFAELLSWCEEHEAKIIRVVATMALRTAENRDEFIGSIWHEHHLPVTVLSGAQEARLSRFGALLDLPETLAPEQEILTFDTGGGSTEFCIGTYAHISKCFSLDIGAHYLLNRFANTDPISDGDYDSLCHFVSSGLQPHLANLHPVWMIGVGGTPVSLYRIHQNRQAIPAGARQELKLEDLHSLIELFRSMPDAQRKLISGLPAERSDTILFGAVIVKSVLELLAMPSFIVSNNGLRHGVMLEMG